MSSATSLNKKTPYIQGNWAIGQRVRIPFYDAHKVPCLGVIIGYDPTHERRPYLVRSRQRPHIILRCSAESMTAASL